jgi:UMF1 family MFS transporter
LLKQKISFALFDTGETILSALIFSTFFPLYIVSYIDTKIYTSIYGISFGISFIIALILGKIADQKRLRKKFFVFFVFLTSFFCFLLYVFYDNPFISLLVFILLAISHQQTMVFYNSMLLDFEEKGIVSGIGVAFGYIGSATALVFLAKYLNIPDVYIVVFLIFLIFSFPSIYFLKNPEISTKISIISIFKEKKFIFTILAILSLTEVANSLVALMGIYLNKVYGLENVEIYKIIGLSAIGGIVGGIFWGFLTDKYKAEKIFLFGFFIWTMFLILLPVIPENLILFIGFIAGAALSHIWTVSRVLILEKFPSQEASTRLSFLSLTERIASTTGLLAWSLFLLLTGNNFKLSAFLMVVFPVAGIIFYRLSIKKD